MMEYRTAGFLRESDLRGLERDYFAERTRGNVAGRPEEAQVTVFLSHSHRDRELVRGFVTLLARLGVQVYVDWQDADMPRVTDRETAERVRTQIGRNEIFFALMTASALASRWVPWEIGIADQRKQYERMWIVPVADATGCFEGSEYLQLYQRISLSVNGNLAAFPPGETDGFALEGVLRWFAGTL